ncbi:MAG: hypothetical protein RR630_08865 [Coprobacillus sp.]
MSQYKILSERFYKFFKYSIRICLVSLGAYLIVTAINTNNSTLDIVSYFLLILTMATAFESSVLYLLYIVLRNK